MPWNEGVKTLTAGEDLEAKRRVKIEAGTIQTPPEVIHAGVGEAFIGVTEYAVKDGQPVAVRLKSASGTFEIECVIDTAIAPGTALYGAADGKVSDAVSGSVQGIALQVASADNEHIEVALDA